MNIIPDFLEFQQEFVDELEIDMLNYDFYATIYNIMFITQQSLHEVNSSEPRALYGGLGQDTRCVGIIGL